MCLEFPKGGLCVCPVKQTYKEVKTTKLLRFLIEEQVTFHYLYD